MERYSVWEGHMDGLRKKVQKIANKCAKFGCDFHFEEVGEEYKVLPDTTTINPVTGKPVERACRFVIVEAEGTSIVGGWEFVASVEHTEKGNIYSKALTDVEIPERYRCSDPYCEHCNSKRVRKGTFIIRNTETGDFKQVGNTCLKDFTCGMSASFVTYLASIKDIFREEEARPVSFGGWYVTHICTEDVLHFAAETIRHFGYSNGSNMSDSTKAKTMDFYHVWTGETRWMPEAEIDRIKTQMESVNFNPDSEEAAKMTAEALEWLNGQEGINDYMHNLKTVCALEYTGYAHVGLLVSLFPTFNRELERQAQIKADKEAGKASEYVGEIGDKVTVDVSSIKCVTSWENCFNGYSTQTTYLYKIVGADGNIYTWKTAKWLDAEYPPKQIKGTVKEHTEYREVKQTELTRCRVA